MEDYDYSYQKAKALAEEITRLMCERDPDADIGRFPEIIDLLKRDPQADVFLYNMSDSDYLTKNLSDYRLADPAEGYAELESRIRRRKKRRTGRRLSILATAAACIIAVLFLLFPTGPDSGTSPQALPGAPRLILESGETILLDSENLSNLFLPGVASASRTEIVLHENPDELIPPCIHTLIVPEQQHYRVTLPDGTRVELNADSELRFPSRFTQEERLISFRGEGYFTVEPSEVPFMVSTEEMQVRVYGTQFQVQTGKSGFSRTLLIEGKVGVTPEGGDEILLDRNQMLTLDAGTAKVTVVDPENYLGWRTGLFSYELASLEHIFEDISAWYGIDFMFENRSLASVKVSISLSRSMDLDRVIETLEEVTRVQIRKERSHVYVISNR